MIGLCRCVRGSVGVGVFVCGKVFVFVCECACV